MSEGPGPAPLLIDRSAPVRRIELDATSWVDLAEGFVPDAGAHGERLLATVPWAQAELLRYDHYMAEQRLSAGLDAAHDPLLRQIGLHLDARHGVHLSGVAAVLYRDGADQLGLHSDREMRWLDDTLVAIVVLGARRPFVLRRRAESWTHARAEVGLAPGAGDRDDADVVLTPGEGDLLVMGGACQRDWMHGVPAAPGAGPRISLTWRWTSRRGRPDTAPGYREGRQAAGAARRPGFRTRRA